MALKREFPIAAKIQISATAIIPIPVVQTTCIFPAWIPGPMMRAINTGWTISAKTSTTMQPTAKATYFRYGFRNEYICFTCVIPFLTRIYFFVSSTFYSKKKSKPKVKIRLTLILRIQFFNVNVLHKNFKLQNAQEVFVSDQIDFIIGKVLLHLFDQYRESAEILHFQFTIDAVEVRT